MPYLSLNGSTDQQQQAEEENKLALAILESLERWNVSWLLPSKSVYDKE